MEAARKITTNRILETLTPEDLARLKPELETVELPMRKLLEARHRTITHVYFIDSGLGSVVVTGGSHHTIEVGMIGHEGLTGLAVVMGTDRSPHEVFIQSSGTGRRITSEALLAAMADSPTLRQRLLHHAFTFQVQMSFTALANARHTVGERLARWLLMSEDRLGPQVDLTHEFLSLMLGVRRPGVTTTLNVLEKQGVIKTKRGSVTICNRLALLEAANGCYGAPEAEYERLFGKSIR